MTPPGAIHAGDAVAGQAQVDLTTAYNSLAGRAPTANLTGQNLGGLTLTPGVYTFNTAAQLTGHLTLNALGNPNAVFIFNIGSTLTTASSASVTVIGGGQGTNVFWRVGSSATLGTTTTFVGDILALTSITLNTGANIACGSALARNGAVTLDTNNIAIGNLAPCTAALLPVPPVNVPPGTIPVVVAPGGTPVAVPVAVIPVITAINTTFTNTGGAMPQAFLNLSSATPADLVNIVLPQLSGEAGTGVAQVGIQSMNSFLSLVLNPFAGSMLGDSRGPADAPAGVRTLGFAPESPLPPGAVSSYASFNKAPAASAFDQRRWSIWAAAYGGNNETSGDASSGTHDRSARVFGFATGLDYRVTRDTTVGFAIAGGGTNYELSNGLGSGRSDMVQGALYGSTHVDAAYVSAAVAYAWHRVSTDRWLTLDGIDHLDADFSATNFGGRVEAGYRFVMPGVFGMTSYGFTPYVALQAQQFHTPAYREVAASGSPVFALAYESRTSTALRTEVGAWFDRSVALDNGTILALRTRAAWAHDEWSDPTVTAAFQSLPGLSFIVFGPNPAHDSLLVSAGAEIAFKNGISLAGRFDTELSDRSQTYAGTGRVRYTW